jgi:hypothetical protein
MTPTSIIHARQLRTWMEDAKRESLQLVLIHVPAMSAGRTETCARQKPQRWSLRKHVRWQTRERVGLQRPVNQPNRQGQRQLTVKTS